MTKEDLYTRMLNTVQFNKIKESLDEFFDSNICIPKGTNRHPYADVYHAYAEGIDIQHSFDNGKTWVDTTDCSGIVRRIKPQEPAYEWQWYCVYGGLAHIDGSFYTQQEINDFGRSKAWIKIEETKKIRQ